MRSVVFLYFAAHCIKERIIWKSEIRLFDTAISISTSTTESSSSDGMARRRTRSYAASSLAATGIDRATCYRWRFALTVTGGCDAGPWRGHGALCWPWGHVPPAGLRLRHPQEPEFSQRSGLGDRQPSRHVPGTARAAALASRSVISIFRRTYQLNYLW